MNRTNKTSLFFWLFLLLAGGCTQADVQEGDDIPPHALKEVEAVFQLDVQESHAPKTRSITFTVRWNRIA